jgi:large subunit ribosomal protein L4
MKIKTFSIKGVSTGEVALPKEFGVEINMPLLAQAVHVYEERAHIGLRKTKTRAEVNRTTKKIYKQKGTGGARHGSRRANLYVGGGVALGPRPVRRILSLSNKMKTRAKFIAYGVKAKEDRLVMASGLAKIEKTNSVKDLLKALRKISGVKSITFVLSDGASGAYRSLRNLAQVKAVSYRDAGVFDIFSGGMIVMDEGIFETKKENQPRTTLASSRGLYPRVGGASLRGGRTKSGGKLS